MLADFPMTKNKEVLKAAWEKTAACKESTERRGSMPGEKR